MQDHLTQVPCSRRRPRHGDAFYSQSRARNSRATDSGSSRNASCHRVPRRKLQRLLRTLCSSLDVIACCGRIDGTRGTHAVAAAAEACRCEYARCDWRHTQAAPGARQYRNNGCATRAHVRPRPRHCMLLQQQRRRFQHPRRRQSTCLPSSCRRTRHRHPRARRRQRPLLHLHVFQHQDQRHVSVYVRHAVDLAPQKHHRAPKHRQRRSVA